LGTVGTVGWSAGRRRFVVIRACVRLSVYGFDLWGCRAGSWRLCCLVMEPRCGVLCVSRGYVCGEGVRMLCAGHVEVLCRRAISWDSVCCGR